MITTVNIRYHSNAFTVGRKVVLDKRYTRTGKWPLRAAQSHPLDVGYIQIKTIN